MLSVVAALISVLTTSPISCLPTFPAVVAAVPTGPTLYKLTFPPPDCNASVLHAVPDGPSTQIDKKQLILWRL